MSEDAYTTPQVGQLIVAGFPAVPIGYSDTLGLWLQGHVGPIPIAEGAPVSVKLADGEEIPGVLVDVRLENGFLRARLDEASEDEN